MLRKVWNKLGWTLFWFCLPALNIYLRRGNRPRIAITSGGKILVVRAWLSDGRWHLPGGGLHRHEDPKTGVLRELTEETGISITATAVSKKDQRVQNADLLYFTYDLFTATLPKPELPPHTSREIAAVAWVDKKDLRPSNAQQHVLDALK